MATSWVAVVCVAVSSSLGFSVKNNGLLFQSQKILLSSAEQAAEDHGGFHYMAVTDSLCYSLFWAISWHLRYTDLTSYLFSVCIFFLLHCIVAKSLIGSWGLSGSILFVDSCLCLFWGVLKGEG